MKLWRRWDPRMGRLPYREVSRVKDWVVEVVPDIFEPGQGKLLARTLAAISALPAGDFHGAPRGRVLLRTAHPTLAVAELRRLHDEDARSSSGYGGARWRRLSSRLVLALYAETQAEFDARVVELFAPRVSLGELAKKDPEAALKLAHEERWICDPDDTADYWHKDIAAARAGGPERVAAFLVEKTRHKRSTGIPVANLALYLSPREVLDVGTYLAAVNAANAKYEGRTSYYGDGRVEGPSRTFDWMICAGKIGPIAKRDREGGRGDSPWPMHPQWIANLIDQARAAILPFCLPHLGEWAPVEDIWWDGDRLVASGSWSGSDVANIPAVSVDYDPAWTWGNRGWNSETPGAKPSAVYMEAIGSALSGRALGGRVFDRWPRWRH